MADYEEITFEVPEWLYKKFKKMVEDEFGKSENALSLAFEEALEMGVAWRTAQTLVEQRRGLER